MAGQKRDVRFEFVMSNDEDVMLEELAEAKGVKKAQVLRTLVRDQHAVTPITNGVANAVKRRRKKKS
jgi:hypothetical protein